VHHESDESLPSRHQPAPAKVVKRCGSLGRPSWLIGRCASRRVLRAGQMTWHPGEIYKASEKIHHALSEAMKELPRESLQFLKFRACDPIIRHKAAEVLDSRELVIWPEDVERPPRARRLLPESPRDRWRIRQRGTRPARRVVERGLSREGDRPSPTRLEPAHARGRARHRLRHAEGVGARERLCARHVPPGQVANLRKSMS
jgi:hypothetical protein